MNIYKVQILSSDELSNFITVYIIAKDYPGVLDQLELKKDEWLYINFIQFLAKVY